MLIHFTKSIEALDSILRYGFLFLHNETGVLGPAAREAFGIIADDQSNGMACFTELLPEETSQHQLRFGSFGVGVSKDWLIQQGAQKVMYVPVGGAGYRALVASMRALAPRTLWGEPLNTLLLDTNRKVLVSLALTDLRSAKEAGASHEYISLLEGLAWTQTDQDISQREWRIRNPNPYRFTGSPNMDQKIALLVNCLSNPNIPDKSDGLLQATFDGTYNIACVGKLSLALRLPLHQIEALFCPEDYQYQIREALAQAGLQHIPVVARD